LSDDLRAARGDAFDRRQHVRDRQAQVGKAAPRVRHVGLGGLRRQVDEREQLDACRWPRYFGSAPFLILLVNSGNPPLIRINTAQSL